MIPSHRRNFTQVSLEFRSGWAEWPRFSRGFCFYQKFMIQFGSTLNVVEIKQVIHSVPVTELSSFFFAICYFDTLYIINIINNTYISISHHCHSLYIYLTSSIHFSFYSNIYGTKRDVRC